MNTSSENVEICIYSMHALIYVVTIANYEPKLWNEIDPNIIDTSPHLHSFKGYSEC